MFAPVKGRRLSGEIAGQIRDAVLGRRLRAGDRLPLERELARIFGTCPLVARGARHTPESDGPLPIHLVVVHARMDLEAGAVVPGLALTADDNAQLLGAHEAILAAIRAGRSGPGPRRR